MAARRSSTLNPVRKAKKYVKEAVMGVVGTAVAAGLLAAFGINGNNPFASDPNTPQGKLAKVVEEVAVEAKAKVAEAAHEGKLPKVAPETQKKIEAMLASTTGALRSNSTSTSTSSSSDPLVGKWEQLVYNPGNSQWYSGGIFQVSGKPSSYSISYLDYSRNPAEFVNAAGITDVAFANDEWTFSSKVDANEVLTFKLRRVDGQTFQGYCYQNGQQVAANTWRRVP
jgi:hypothetical protein